MSANSYFLYKFQKKSTRMLIFVIPESKLEKVFEKKSAVFFKTDL